jgi:putative acetyltransferase
VNGQPVTIRPEEPRDAADIRVVHARAFGRTSEAALVDALRGVTGAISLVAAIADRVVGHVLFTPVHICDPGSDEGRTRVGPGSDGGQTGVRPGSDPVAEIAMPAVGLAPMAVVPEHQRQGIGSDLVRAGLNACRAEGHTIVVVLGHPAFYGRFGFITASSKGITCEYQVPAEAFMVRELTAGALGGIRGVVRYRPEFGA